MKKAFLLLSLSLFITCLVAQDYTEVKIKDIPKSITASIKKNMNSAPILRAATATENGVLKYYIVIEMRGDKSILVYDKTGKLLGRQHRLNEKQKAAAKNASDKKPEGTTTPVKK
jgi:hypothetical protein